MASLSTLVKKYSHNTLEESNLEKGHVSLIYPFTQWGADSCEYHHRFNNTGLAIIEIWGGAGSVGKNCCCSIALPGNPPAYAKKSVCVSRDTWMCVCLGFSCGNSDTMCFRGCSLPTKAYICSPKGTLGGTGAASCYVCICAEGGMGGPHHCQSPSQAWSAQYVTEGYCFTDNGGSGGCGVVCNYGGTHTFLPQAYGGDFNCPGGISCMCANSCDAGPGGFRCFAGFVRTAAGLYGPEPRTICYQHSCQTFLNGHYDGYMSFVQNVNMNKQHPDNAGPNTMICDSAQWCGCYDDVGCMAPNGPGLPGWGSVSCGGVRGYGGRGGHGAVRIRFIANEDMIRREFTCQQQAVNCRCDLRFSGRHAS
tara:strand:+ start:3222 stop:4313 length:1092 start_codon:yes stop_codon:yes gene_type:complete